jgi:hypothetical protein
MKRKTPLVLMSLFTLPGAKSVTMLNGCNPRRDPELGTAEGRDLPSRTGDWIWPAAIEGGIALPGAASSPARRARRSASCARRPSRR